MVSEEPLIIKEDIQLMISPCPQTPITTSHALVLKVPPSPPILKHVAWYAPFLACQAEYSGKGLVCFFFYGCFFLDFCMGVPP